MTQYRKKLIEVALPLKAINEASAREKSIRHGHPSTLHLWWARRPLAACRAVLFASLVDDPDSDPVYRRKDGSVDEEAAATKRAELFNLIEELVQWENSNNPDVIRSARAEIARCVASRKMEIGELKADDELATGITVKKFIRDCHCQPIYTGTQKNKKRTDSRRFSFGVAHLPPADIVNKFLVKHAPPALDPFCGGGSIPLEAQRLGLRTFASDLNPVPVLINKALIEIPHKFAGLPPVNPGSGKTMTGKGRGKKPLLELDWPGATGLAEDVRYYGTWMRDEAEKRIGHLYPRIEITEQMTRNRPDLLPLLGKQLTTIAWLWARTIQCPNPGCRARTPLVRSFWLSRKAGKEFFARPFLNANTKTVRFSVMNNGEPPKHTTDRTGARCLFCDTFIKKQLLRDVSLENGISPIPLAVVAQSERERIYLDGDSIPSPSIPRPSVPFLEQPMTNDRRWFSPPLYGMPNFADLFTSRQLVMLITLCSLVEEVRERIRNEAIQPAHSTDERSLVEGGLGIAAYSDAIATYLGEAVSKTTAFHCVLAAWRAKEGKSARAFGRQAIPMVWDFTEVNPFASAGGSLDELISAAEKTIAQLPATCVGHVTQHDAAHPHQERHCLVSTDPPYYDNVGYADLSDYYYVWLRAALSNVYRELFSTVLSPKSDEMIATPLRHDNDKAMAEAFFEERLGHAFIAAKHSQSNEVPMTIYYGFRQSEEDDPDDDADDGEVTVASTGWETMLEGIVKAGFSIVGTWPIRTESVVGLKTTVNALASSIVLVCRPRSERASLATRKEFIAALRIDLPDALRNLQRGNIAPVDLAQAAIGPGMAVFTRYQKVVESDGTAMTVRTALGILNQVLDEVLAEQEGDFDPDTRWTLAWFEQFGMNEGPFGVAETLSKAKNTAVNGLVEAGVVKAKGGKVQLIARDEMSDAWNPASDSRLTVWETTQHLIRTLESDGESGAAALLQQLGGLGEASRELAYRLYSICERNKWPEEALAFNSLVTAWPELTKLALASRNREPAESQPELFD